MIKSSRILFFLLLLALILFRLPFLVSRLLTNYSAFLSPQLSMLHSSDMKFSEDLAISIHKWALFLDNENTSALLQEFQWLVYERNFEQASTLLPKLEKNYSSYFKVLPSFPIINANYEISQNNWRGALSSYQAYLALFPYDLGNEEKDKYYKAYANYLLEVEPRDESEVHYLVGKIFMKVGDKTKAVEQANWVLNNLNTSNEEQICWANGIKIESDLGEGKYLEASQLLDAILSKCKNVEILYFLMKSSDPRSSKIFRDIQPLLSRNEIYKPDWQIAKTRSTCSKDFVLVGFDTDDDLFFLDQKVSIDLYWLPICGEKAEKYSMINVGAYWIQPNYEANNLLLNPGFEWILQPDLSTFNGSSDRCCKILGLEKNKVLEIQDQNFPTTRAATQKMQMKVDNNTTFLVAGKFKWGRVNLKGNLYGIIGGFWLDNNGNRISGFNNEIDFLQVFIKEKQNLSNDSLWLKKASVVMSPSRAAFFSPWFGITSQSIGSAGIYLDDVMMIPLRYPELK